MPDKNDENGKKEIVLGLDLGTASIGWALIEYNAMKEPERLIGCGSRIFPEVVDAKTRTPKNHARRDHRSTRKVIKRRRMRRDKLQNILIQKNMLPKDKVERTTLLTDTQEYCPYTLRKKALDEELTLYELGRALYHLGNRRGFLSNRKTDKKTEAGPLKKSIGELNTKIAESGARTLGEYFKDLEVPHDATKPRARRYTERLRDRYTERAMYLAEFDAIWKAQEEFRPDLMTNALRVAIKKAIFDQRPLKIQKHLVGGCTFEPCDADGVKITVWDRENQKELAPIRKRAARAILPAQRFRILQDVNNLMVKDPATRDYRELLPEERKTVISKLERQKTLGWGAMRKALKLNENETFNLEEGKKTSLLGDSTAYALEKILGKKWQTMNSQDRDRLITDMLTIDSVEGLMRRLTGHWGFDEATAEKIADTELENGYMSLSRKAILKIIPHMEDGLKYDDACKAAGYHHSEARKTAYPTKFGEVPNLRNPVVQKALNETRKLINAITGEYGHPDKIRIEMARDMKLSEKKKKEVQFEQNKLKKANEQAAKELIADFGIEQPSRADIQKYNLWHECNKICPYTGTSISGVMLFSGEVDIEHILPYSRTLDDSYMNKTLCMANENRSVKHSRTPYEAYHSNEKKYNAITQRVKKYSYKKLRRFEQKEVDTDQFVTRQLNDTRYICKEVKRFLEGTGSTVEVTKGMATAVLRHIWELNRVLGDDILNVKERIDHRHHAVDAIVIALTDRRLFKRLSKISASCDGLAPGRRGFDLPQPWPGFFNEVCDKIDEVIVSHAQSHAIKGALHEDTAYGYSEAEGCFVVRKPVESLTKPMIAKIRDDKVRGLIEMRIKEFDGDMKQALGDKDYPVLHTDGKTPIRSVRIATRFNKDTVHAIKDRDGAPYKYFKYGNNHHVEILENLETGKRKGVFVTAMEAAKRARRGNTEIVQRYHGPEWRFVMALFKNDMVEVIKKEHKKYFRVRLLDGSNEVIDLRLHSTSTLDNKDFRLLKKANTLKCRKVSINTIGKIGPSND